MGELRNCPVCGKVFVKLLKNLCPDCIDKEEREFEEVRLYLKDNPGASIGEISEFTGVDEDKILKWMREDRIDVCVGKGGVLTCKRCGSDIIAGNLCSKCAQVLAAEIKSATHSVPLKDTEPDKPKEPKGRGMFVAQKLRDDN
ncbi:MAG: hypothetical protein WC834_03025 [Eubacteriales bacterium]|nr:MAG: MerR family transcriptional regulator [Firmicutes bacterium HGW-Firmicutes-8]